MTTSLPLGSLQLGNVIATPNANTTPAQVAAAQAAGWKSTTPTVSTGGGGSSGGSASPSVTFDSTTGQPSNAVGFKVINGTKTWVDSTGNPVSQQSSGTSAPDGHTVSSYVVPKYNASSGAGTLSGIANELGISTLDLLKSNPSITNPNLLYEGQKLNVPQKGVPVVGYTPASTSSQGFGSTGNTTGFGSTGANPTGADTTTSAAGIGGTTAPVPAPQPATREK